MSGPLTLGIAQSAVALASGTLGILKEAREAAKRSEDHDLKNKLSEVFDNVLELKESIFALRDENEQLRKQLQTKRELKWDTREKVSRVRHPPNPPYR